MSFGFGVGDVIAVAGLAFKLYQFCFIVSRGAPHEFQLLLQQITSLSQSVQLLQLEAKNPNSTLMSSGPDRIQMVGEVMCRVKETLTELERFAVKYEKLGDTKRPKRKQIWDKFKWSSEAESLDSLRNKLIYHNGIINLLLTSCGNSSLERIEISNRVLERRFSQIGTFIQKIEGHGGSSISPTISTIRVGDRAFKGAILSALLIKSAEVGNRRWLSIGVDEWIQAGRWWLLKSQSRLQSESTSEPGQIVSTQGYTDLIKASWVLIDVIARHPQFNLLDPSIRLDVEQLAEAIRSELETFEASAIVPPSSDQIQACDLSIWELQAKGASIQPGKRPESGYLSWETEDEHVLLQRFAHYRPSEFSTSTPCIVLLVAHKQDKAAHIVLRDQSWTTLATFEIGDSHPRPRLVGNFTHIGDQKIEFSTARDAMYICAMTDAVEEYIFHCLRNENEQATLLVLLILFAIKNGYKEVVKQTLQDHPHHNLKPNTTPSPTITIWQAASHLATLRIRTVTRTGNKAEPQRTGVFRSLLFWTIQEGYNALATQLMQLKGIIVIEEEIHQWADLRRAARNGLSEVVRFILSENGTTLDFEGQLAYHLAACNGHSELVQELLTIGVVHDIRPYDGWTNTQVRQRQELVPEKKYTEQFNDFIESKPGLMKFYDSKALDLKIKKAKTMHDILIANGCDGEFAVPLSLLTLYDIVMLLDDSSSMNYVENGTRKDTLRKTLEEITKIYDLANDTGILSVRFINNTRGRKNVVNSKVASLFLNRQYEGATKIGTAMEKRILEPFVYMKTMTKPLLVITIMDGIIDGESNGLLKYVIKKCVHRMKGDDSLADESVAFRFCRVGNDEGAMELLRDLADCEEVREYIDCLPVDEPLEALLDVTLKWGGLVKLLTGALGMGDRVRQAEDDEFDLDVLEMSTPI